MRVALGFIFEADQTMKILFITPSLLRGGAEEYLLTIASEAARRGYKAYAVFPRTKKTLSLIEDCKRNNISYYPLFVRRAEQGQSKVERFFRNYVQQFLKVLLLFVKIKPDVAHISLGWPGVGFGIIMACGLLKLPTVVTFQLIDNVLLFSKNRLKAYKWARSRKQQWVAVSENNRLLVSRTFNIPKDEIRLIYNGCKIESSFSEIALGKVESLRNEVRRELSIPENSKILLTVGRLSKQKGYEDIIPIIPEIVREFPKAAFVWVGEGELMEQLTAKVKQASMAEKVLLLGLRKDAARLMRASDIFLFPTRFEGMPFVLFEAMVHGLPIVSSDASGIPEVIKSGEHGLLFAKKDREALLWAIRWALQNSAQMEKMAQRAKARVADFSEENMINQTFDVLEDLAGVPSPAACCGDAEHLRSKGIKWHK